MSCTKAAAAAAARQRQPCARHVRWHAQPPCWKQPRHAHPCCPAPCAPGLPLNYQLTELGATLVRTVRTAPVYSEWRCLQACALGSSAAAVVAATADDEACGAAACRCQRADCGADACSARRHVASRPHASVVAEPPSCPRPCAFPPPVRLLPLWLPSPPPEMFSLGPKPALIRQPPGVAGAAIELEVWELPIEKVG